MKTALITGSSTGIGRETALQLASRGWRVLAGVRKDSDSRSLIEEAAKRKAPGRIEPVLLDITDPAHIQAASRDIRALDALINNAGIPIVGPVEALAMDRWKRQFEVNFFGHIDVTRAFLPALRAARGRIVFISSIAGLVGQPFLSPYSASKHAMEALGDALRIELAPDGIGVTLIEPGAIKTPIWRRGEENTKAALDAMTPEMAKRYGARVQQVSTMALDAESKGLEPTACAEAIIRSILARTAPARIILGRDAKIAAFAQWLLPRSVFDAILKRAFGV